VQGGVTTYGDDRNWKIALTGGTDFANGRGHLLLSGEAARIDGIEGTPRDWAKTGAHIILNPAYVPGNGQPIQIIRAQTSQSNQTPGGIITGGPLKGITFGPGGVPYQFNYGSVIKDPWMQGGQWAANDVTALTNTLDPSETRQTAFARLSYQITDDIEVYGQWNWAYDDSLSGTSSHFNPGDLTVKADNAFIPANIRAQMTTLGLASLPFGTMSADVPYLKARNTRLVRRYVAGADGKVDAFGTTWGWDAYYQGGESGATKRFYDRFKSKLNLALDSVLNPQGIAVCRSTLTNPTNGCVPFNLFGVGVNSQAAVNYISGWSFARETYREEVMAASVHGEPFANWAGPVSFATGIEHRVEAGGGIQSAANAANDSYVGNQAPVIGSYNVTEGFVETVFPLMKDASWGQSLDLNAAARFTSYSTSGFVTTWKAGLTYQPIDDLRFRATRSRDIRAPNRTELFAAGIFTGNLVNDPFHGNQPVNVQSLQVGNRNLKPEKADTTGFGVVIQPSFFPGFSTSVDYYDIKISDAISTVGRQDVPNRCFAGETAFCSALTFDPITGFLSQVVIQPTNFLVQRTRGIDFEAGYNLPLENINSAWGGDLSLRALATKYITDYTNSGTAVQQFVGGNSGNGPPHWKYSFAATYSLDPIIVSVSGRGFSAGNYTNGGNVAGLIGCTSACPAITGTTLTQDIIDLPGALYWDTSLTYKFAHMEDNGYDAEAFFSVRNITNKDPAIVAQGTSGVAFSTPPCNALMYDCLGRTFKAGIRFKLGAAAPMKKAEAAPMAAAAPPPAPTPITSRSPNAAPKRSRRNWKSSASPPTRSPSRRRARAILWSPPATASANRKTAALRS
jgi:iron complex outermembrane receptor protein